MKKKIKRHSRSALSVLLSLCMLVSCITVGMIGTDAAQTLDAVGASADEASVGAEIGDDESVGATYYLLLGTSNNPSSWNKYVTSSSKSFTITPSSFGLSSFALNTNYYVAVSSSSSYTNMYAQNASSSASASGSSISSFTQSYNIGSTTYNFAGFKLSSAADSVTVTESGSNPAAYTFTAVSPTYTAIGDSTALFGTAWAPTATENDMTKSGTTYTWTKSNVYLEQGDINYKVAKDHGWTTTYPSENATKTVSTAGYYNVTVTYNSSTNEVSMTLTNVTPHTLTVDGNVNAVVTAKYNGTIAGEGETLTVPPNETVTVTVTPNAGYKLSSITSSGGGATSVSGNTGTLTMPAADTTLSVTLTEVDMKPIYFNNNNTDYSMVSAKYTYNGSTTTNTMTRLPNSNVWSIDVPEDLEQITFVGDNGYNTGALTIPWASYTKPKYTAGTDRENPATGGTWGEYTARANEVIVTNGDTITNGINNGTLFAGITATMYDYYADGEVNSGATNWLTGINTTANQKEYSTDANDWKWNSFTKLNSALSAYASSNSVTYPLYFGNLNVWSDNGNGNAIGDVGHSNKSTITGYHNWNQNANGSIHLSNSSDAVTGLSGKTLANSNIHYYKSGASNENGAVMAMFDEDFLSGENNQNAALATILRSSFPVRISNVGASTTYPNKVYVSAGGFAPGSGGELWARFLYVVNGSDVAYSDVELTLNGSYYEGNIPTNYAYNKVIFVRQPSSNHTGINWTDYWNESNRYDVPSSTTSAARLYTFNSWGSGKKGCTFNVSNIASSYGTTSGGHTYYEFDSTDGKDNAYVRAITKPTSSANGTATLEYYNNTNKVYSASYGNAKKDEGFFPFDYNNYINQVDSHAHDLGFGMKLEIPFTLEENGQFSDGTHQTFDFSGDDDLWVFIDGNLVLDLGGEHFKSSGSIDFATETVTVSNQEKIGSATRNDSFASWFDNTNPNIVHTMTLYYMERGMFDSNLKFGFSFHAIPNQLKTEKKVRTANINSGFYVVNELTESDITIDDNREITWFEKSYQYEPITITHSSGSAPNKNPVTYSLRDNSNTTDTLVSSNNYGFDYSLYNDNIAYFLGQYSSGTNINLKEDLTGTKYNYTPSVVVYDDANNQAVVSGSGDISSSGYQFAFSPTVTGAIDNLNIRARVTNQMKSHDLTITKAVNGSDTSTKFKIKVEFNFDMAAVVENSQTICSATTKGYHTYPLFVSLNGEEEQLYPDGTIFIDSDDTLVIPKIPENAQMKITEVIDDTNAYGYKSTTVTGTGITATNVEKGVEFQMGTSNATAVINNYKGKLDITHQVHPDSEANGETYVSAKVKNGNTDVATYAEVSSIGAINVDPQYIKKDSTNSLEIVLRSELTESNTNFEDFYEEITGTINHLAASGTPYTAVIDKSNMTATVTVAIADLFNNGTQVYNRLPFYSKFSPEDAAKATIRVKYAPSYYDFQQGTNITQDEYKKDGSVYNHISQNVLCVTDFTDEASSTTEITQYTQIETATKDASKDFEVQVTSVNDGGYLFIGWYDGDGNRYNNSDATQHSFTASAPKDKDRIFEARFITQPTYRIDYDTPTRLWGSRIYKVFGKVDNSMITNGYIGYDSSRETTASVEKRYYLTGDLVEAKKPSETIFLKNITWPNIDNGKASTEYNKSKTVTSNTDTSKNVETVTGTVTYDLYRSVAASVSDRRVTVDFYNDCSDPDTLVSQWEGNYGDTIANNNTYATNIPAGKTFYRWRIETLNSLGGTALTENGVLVTYDYSKNFNYVAYDNYKVTAEVIDKIGDSDFNPNSASNSKDPYHAYAPTNVSTVVNLGQTRSHWNDTEDGTVYVPDEGESTNYTNANYNYDRMFIDLALSYSDGSETKLNESGLDVGFIVQYKQGDNWVDWKTVTFSSSLLGDKNRIEYYYGFQNATGNRNAKFRVQPIIAGVASGAPVEFDFSASQFSAQTNY